MKLFTRYSRINVFATVIIFLIASLAFFFTLRFVLTRQIDDDLRIEEREIKNYIAQFHHLPENISVKDQVIEYTALPSSFKDRYFQTTHIRDHHNSDKEQYRQLVFGIRVNGVNYRVSVSKSLEDTDDMITSIALIVIITILAILVASFIINRVLLKRIWKPFYTSLDMIRDFKVGSPNPLVFSPVETDEFSHMNKAIEKLTRQAQHDYLSLKTFSENASHEIQTPIAIVRSKLDILIQDEKLTELQSQAVQSAYNAIQRLSRLNQSLLLLAKIENNQYENVEKLDLREKVRQKLEDFQELWLVHNISTEADLQPASIMMNQELADILVNNLLSNATRHNYPGGRIAIQLHPHSLEVRNTSSEPGLKPESMFRRFSNTGRAGESNGLGLSIIKQICEASGFTLDYHFTDDEHLFKISWS